MTSSFNLNELDNVLGGIKQYKTYSEIKENQKSDILRLSVNNDNFTFKTANMFLILLVLTSLYDVFYNYTKTGIFLFIINLCLLHFYNMNYNIFNDFDTKDILNNLNSLVNSTSLFIFSKTKYIGEWLFDKLFSKNTQFVLKIIFRIVKSNIVSKYRYYRNAMFNPKLLNETNNEYVYCVPLYLDGVNYKIPIVVDKHKTKNPPIMILNKDEEDITSKLTDYLGPNYDFFGIILKPKHFGEKSLSFMLDDGSETTMDENDLMVL